MLIKIYFSAQSALTKEELRRDLAQAASVFAARVSSIVYLIINTKTWKILFELNFNIGQPRTYFFYFQIHVPFHNSKDKRSFVDNIKDKKAQMVCLRFKPVDAGDEEWDAKTNLI